MKKIALTLAAALIAWALGYWIYLLCASDSTRIRWLIEKMERGFNASSARATVSGLADGFVEETSGVEREEIHKFLLYLFFHERDPQTKEFKYRVELDPPEIDISAERKAATVKLAARFLERRGGTWQATWEVGIDADLKKGNEGWRIVQSRHRTERGRRPF